MKQILDCFGDVQLLLQKDDIDLPPASKSNLLEVLTNSSKNVVLQLELAITIDVG